MVLAQVFLPVKYEYESTYEFKMSGIVLIIGLNNLV